MAIRPALFNADRVYRLDSTSSRISDWGVCEGLAVYASFGRYSRKVKFGVRLPTPWAKVVGATKNTPRKPLTAPSKGACQWLNRFRETPYAPVPCTSRQILHARHKTELALHDCGYAQTLYVKGRRRVCGERSAAMGKSAESESCQDVGTKTKSPAIRSIVLSQANRIRMASRSSICTEFVWVVCQATITALLCWSSTDFGW